MSIKNNNIKNHRSPEKRENILKAAEALFVRRGFDGVSIMDVAVEAQVAKALIFYYFNNKNELFEAVLDRYYTEQSDVLKTAIGAKGSMRERMHAGIDAYFDYISRNPGYPRLIQGEICSNTRCLDKVLEHMQPLSIWGETLLGDALPQSGHLSAKNLFISLFGMIASFYTYSPVIERLWPDTDDEDYPEAFSEKSDGKESAVEERRRHIHWLLDAVMDKLECEQKKNR